MAIISFNFMSVCFAFLSFGYFDCFVFQLPGDCADEKNQPKTQNNGVQFSFPSAFTSPAGRSS